MTQPSFGCHDSAHFRTSTPGHLNFSHDFLAFPSFNSALPVIPGKVRTAKLADWKSSLTRGSFVAPVFFGKVDFLKAKSRFVVCAGILVVDTSSLEWSLSKQTFPTKTTNAAPLNEL